MGQRIRVKARCYVRRGNRRRRRHLLGKHAYLRDPKDSDLVCQTAETNRSMVPWLLDRGLLPDSGLDHYGYTQLMQAAAHGDVAIMKILLAYVDGADPNAVSCDSETPLGFAVTWEHPAAIRVLVEAGADINNMDDSEPGKTQLDWAILSQWTEVVETLRSLGAKTFAELQESENHS